MTEIGADRLDRAMGALVGVAVGDAMGMPSQTLSQEEITRAYGWIDDFVAPVSGHAVADGLPAASVTDDTEQTLLLADHLIRRQGKFDAREWVEALQEWETSVRDRGLRDLLGPSTKRALEALRAGAPVSEAGQTGTTNGAAMRIAPVAIATAADSEDLFVRRVAETCRVTHGSREAIAAASAVASVISQGVDGAGYGTALVKVFSFCRAGEALGADYGMRHLDERIALATKFAVMGDRSELVATIGTSVESRESVAAAIGVVLLADGDPWESAVIAANLGDDTDTIGSIACAMAGACRGAGSFPADKVQQVVETNQLDLVPVAEGLLALRDCQQN